MGSGSLRRRRFSARVLSALSWLSQILSALGTRALPESEIGQFAPRRLRTVTILAVTGLLREARIVALPGVTPVVGGADPAQLREKLTGAIGKDARGIISIGVGGGLDPILQSGDCIVASEVVDGSERFATDSPWMER